MKKRMEAELMEREADRRTNEKHLAKMAKLATSRASQAEREQRRMEEAKDSMIRRRAAMESIATKQMPIPGSVVLK